LPPASSDADRIAELEARIDTLEHEGDRIRASLREAIDAGRRRNDDLRRLGRELAALRRRRSVRLALAASASLRRLVISTLGIPRLPRRALRSVRRRFRQRRLRASPEAERALIAALSTDPGPSTLERGPLVSIVILNRNGREHLERCLGGVATTAYRDIEIIVVDNGSTDGSAELAMGLDLPFPVRVVRNHDNRSFSAANGQGVALASGPLICFLNNDVDPITPHWLGYMVETMLARHAVAVGARLIYPMHRGGARAGSNLPDLSLQHAGVGFVRSKAVPLPRVMGAGDDATAPWATKVEDRPALTAACLLVRLDAFRNVGGLSPEYDYGIEDVDLCLKLRAAGGQLVYDGRAVLWHHESATRAGDRAQFSARAAANRDTFIDIWGPRIFRDALLDALHGGTRFSSDPFHVAITVADDSSAGPGDRSIGRGLGDALEAHGWRVSYLARAHDGWYSPDPSIEAIIVLHDACDVRRLPRNLVTMAWIHDGAERWLGRVWFDEFDLVFASSERTVEMVRARSAKVARLLAMPTDKADAAGADPHRPRAAAIRHALIDWASAPRYGLRIGTPSWKVIDHWGDYHFARGLQRSLERAGHPTRIHFLPDWESPAAARDDVAVHLFGLKEAPTHRGQVNILWQISHPDLATPEIYERYDHAFVASDRFAARMAERVTVPVTPLHQATDPERFRPEAGGPHHELLFVASSRKVRRRIVDDLAGTTHDLAIYGRDWTPQLVEQRFVKGEVIQNTELARYYSAADIVLNDHWDDMRIEGFISNRLYDALACGAFVISDSVDGIEAEFDGAVPTYGSRAELEPLIARYLEDPDERHRLAACGRAIVLERHTFDLRAQALCDVAEPLATARPAGIDGIAVAS
jgi:GT2 family glycosyltransferase/glycosyltransferase involved in cell wall biosynthesis